MSAILTRVDILTGQIKKDQPGGQNWLKPGFIGQNWSKLKLDEITAKMRFNNYFNLSESDLIS